MKEPCVFGPATDAENGEAAIKAPSRSISPPWPGIRPLVSLTSNLRLSADSNRSPSSDTTAAARPTQNSASSRFVQRASSRPREAPASAPTIAPDQVLPGETLGHSLGPPIKRPAK